MEFLEMPLIYSQHILKHSVNPTILQILIQTIICTLRGIISQNIDHLHQHRVLPFLLITITGSKFNFRVLLRAVALPLIVKRIIAVVPVYGPVVDPLGV